MKDIINKCKCGEDLTVSHILKDYVGYRPEKHA